MTVATTFASSEPPLSREHYAALADARPRFNKVHNAARVVAFNGWTMAIVALLSAPFALSSASSLLTSVGAAVVACLEFRGRRKLLQFDPAAAAMLGWNQLFLMALIVAYCLWETWSSINGPNSISTQLQSNPELADLLGSTEEIESLFTSLTVGFYGSLMALSIVIQGANAIYYFTRRKHLVACLQDTPRWALEIVRLAR
jgi:hypothetical protein